MRNFEVTELVRMQNMPAGGAAELAVHLAPAVSDVAAVAAALGDEFGEMTGASDVAGEGGGSGGGAKAVNGVGSLISLTASSTATDGNSGQAPPGARRVQWGGATVIDVASGSGSSSQDGGAGGSTAVWLPAGVGSGAADPQRPLHRRASLVEVELASGASPMVSPKEGARGSSYLSWLHD